MREIGATIVPLVAIVLVGYFAGRLKVGGPGLRKALLDFCLYFGIPALVLRTIAVPGAGAVHSYAIWTAYLAPVAMCWLVASSIAMAARPRGRIAASSAAMASTYGNVLMLGIPVTLLQFGPAAASVILMIVLVHSPVLFAAATIQSAVEASFRFVAAPMIMGVEAPSRPKIFPRLLRLGSDFITNPIILGILVGLAIRTMGLSLPAQIDSALAVLGQGTLPCVLISVGLGLSTFEPKGRVGIVSAIVTLKLIAMPLLAWWVSARLLHLDGTSVAVITFLCAMPVGANALAFADADSESADSIAAAVAISTMISPISLSLTLLALGMFPGGV